MDKLKKVGLFLTKLFKKSRNRAFCKHNELHFSGYHDHKDQMICKCFHCGKKISIDLKDLL